MDKILTELLKQGGPTWLLVAFVFIIMAIALKMLWSEMAKQRTTHNEDHQQLVRQMFEVVNRNTEANTELKNSVRDLSMIIQTRPNITSNQD